MRVLVVEDDPALREVLRRGLVEEGHAVDAGGGVAGADEALAVNDYDVVVLDVGLPTAAAWSCAAGSAAGRTGRGCCC